MQVSRPIKARRNRKAMQFRITFDSKLKIVERYLGKYCHLSLSSAVVDLTYFSSIFAGNFAREFRKYTKKIHLNCSYKP